MNTKELIIDTEYLQEIINKALAEDIGTGDISTDLIVPTNKTAKAILVSKADGIVAGIDIAKTVFEMLDKDLIWKPKKKDGDHVNANDIIVEFEARYRAILSGERTALNFIQRMSGIATQTSKYVAVLKKYKTEILDTRKTVPGLRLLDKYAVKTGGGTNHRIGLFDMVMLKENHIRIAGGIKKAVEQIKEKLKPGILIEVETTNLIEVEEALSVGADVIMLDNMTNEDMATAVKLIDGKAKVEASGSMNINRVEEVAKLGVDYISVGALTHSVQAFDISQQVVE